jgi:ketosteroid isomerase-like protein
MTRDELVLRVRAFVDAFNRRDLDAVMPFFAEGAVYDELTGKRNAGAAAIRDAFVPQFRGDYGPIVFDEEDLFVDEHEQKALVSWTCRLEGKPGGWRGLDVLCFEDGLIVEKRTYTKADVPKIERN